MATFDRTLEIILKSLLEFEEWISNSETFMMDVFHEAQICRSKCSLNLPTTPQCKNLNDKISTDKHLGGTTCVVKWKTFKFYLISFLNCQLFGLVDEWLVAASTHHMIRLIFYRLDEWSWFIISLSRVIIGCGHYTCEYMNKTELYPLNNLYHTLTYTNNSEKSQLNK